MFNCNPSELLELAIQIEVNGYNYYTKMLEQSSDESVKKIFTYLAEEEKHHVDDFKKLREAITKPVYEISDEYNTPEMETYLKAMFDGRVFPNIESLDEIAKEIKTDTDAIRHALSFEKDTIVFFSEILNMLGEDEENKGVVKELIKQEKIHIAKLFTLLNRL